VRELENVVERAVITSRAATLYVDRGVLPVIASAESLGERLQDQEREAIETALRSVRGRVSGPTGAAVVLGIPSTTLESKIKRLGIDKFRFKSHREGRRVIPMPGTKSKPA
jgi:formate hydrogenlyase transcriptional activator